LAENTNFSGNLILWSVIFINFGESLIWQFWAKTAKSAKFISSCKNFFP